MTGQQGNQQAIVVTAAESVTPAGLATDQTAAAIRAGVSRFTEFPDYMPIVLEFDDEDIFAQAASVDGADGEGLERLYGLAAGPLTKLIEKSGLERSAMAGGGLYFALPFEDEVIRTIKLRRLFIDQVTAGLGLPAAHESGGVPSGSTGVYALMERAIGKMQAGEINFCIIAAVDSYLLSGRLALYDEDWRLQSKRSPAGFIPGEAGAALLLETESFARQRNAPVLLRVDGVGSGQEPNTILESRSSSGAGLTQAIRPLAEARNNQPFRWILSDLNGERYKAYEWGVVLTRLSKIIAYDHQLSYLTEVIGDIGAATAAVQIACVSEAFERGYAPAGSALLFAGNDAGKRGAMLVSQAT